MALILILPVITLFPYRADHLFSDGTNLYLTYDQRLYESESESLDFRPLLLSLPTGFRIRYLDGDRFFLYLGDGRRVYRVRRSDLSLRLYREGEGIVDLSCDDEGRVMTVVDWGERVLLDGRSILPGIGRIVGCGYEDGFYLYDRKRIIFLNPLFEVDSVIPLPEPNLRVIKSDTIFAYDEEHLYKYYEGSWHRLSLPVTIQSLLPVRKGLLVIDDNSHLRLLTD
ncbi:hypothetical protein DRP53_00330 [candidate division WOR-3 bacterium]|uniref:Uncharacterized protein n=1 Tax=candidate division WOR-3 bacterium TaxID=2052148 RepID=A0A660SLY3_UNCW3|nr:MAG: hypothetical protein DRP53_00330 [candidate division WOR-3 bacterium]